MRKIAVLTSGGDAPGMNAAIRAVVRAGLEKGWQVCGVRGGFSGFLNGDFQPLGARDVGGTIHLGGTILGSARCEDFKRADKRERFLRNLQEFGVSGLIVIGGNGSQCGAHALAEAGFPVVGVASTIDNDLFGSDMTIGVDTALNVALEAIDRLKVTASSHKRAFLVEVMGRDSGYLALMTAIAGGAEAVVLPEVETTAEKIAAELAAAYSRGKAHAIAVVAEGSPLNAEALSQYFREHGNRFGFDMRFTTLGHVQRGGAPGAFDRILATRFGVAAVERLATGEHGVLVGLRGGEVAATPLAEVVANKKSLDRELLETARILAK